jgi:hypothetical protein
LTRCFRSMLQHSGLSAKEAAQELHVHQRTVERYCRENAPERELYRMALIAGMHPEFESIAIRRGGVIIIEGEQIPARELRTYPQQRFYHQEIVQECKRIRQRLNAYERVSVAANDRSQAADIRELIWL